MSHADLHISPKAAEITARLTDTSKYTGIHKHRFDEQGNGRGMAGRKNLVDFDGSTTSLHRSHNSLAVDPERPINRSRSRDSDLGVIMDGNMARRIKLHNYGERHHEGEVVVLNRSYPNMDKLKDYTAGMIPAGKPKIILDANHHEIHDLDDIVDGGNYLVMTGFDKTHFDEGRVPLSFAAAAV